MIDEQETWTTRAQASDWIWLAALIDPDRLLRHRGITLFLVPLSSPGVTIQQHRSQTGEIACSVFVDAVEIPDSARDGEVNGGWAVINAALAGERVGMGAITGSLHGLLDDLLTQLRREPGLAPARSAQRATLSALAARLQAARLLVRDTVEATTSGTGSRLQAPMAAVMGGELAEQFGRTVPELVGPRALLEESAGNGGFGHNLCFRPSTSSAAEPTTSGAVSSPAASDYHAEEPPTERVSDGEHPTRSLRPDGCSAGKRDTDSSRGPERPRRRWIRVRTIPPGHGRTVFFVCACPGPDAELGGIVRRVFLALAGRDPDHSVCTPAT